MPPLYGLPSGTDRRLRLWHERGHRRTSDAVPLLIRWTPGRVAAIAVGGAVGASGRWAVTTIGAGEFPWPVLVVNIVGSLLLGAILAEHSQRPANRMLLHDAGGIGFCGGLTTFSTFSLEIVELIDDGETAVAAVYGVVSIAGAIAAVVAGAAAVRRVHARRPAEERS
ncbi:MAG: CrcB family protein [Acidimicrobiia bacterium]|nr:CrcB family protein [Acidimicrobiia bacterium]